MEVDFIYIILISSFIVTFTLMVVFFGIPKRLEVSHKEAVSKRHLNKTIELSISISLYFLLMLGVVLGVKSLYLPMLVILFFNIVGFKNE